MSVTVRSARAEDDDALRRIDRETWSTLTSPGPLPPADRRFFDPPEQVSDVLVAEVDGAVVGYVRLQRATPLEASRYVQTVNGIAVDPEAQGRGVGRALMTAAIEEARRRGARKVSLRVLGHNERARALYERCGFVVEGVLRGEFHLDARDVDDVLMALPLRHVPEPS